MRRIVLRVAAAAEAATGILLVAYPPVVVSLLFGAGIAGIGEVMSRFAGLALIGLGVACWPRGPLQQALRGMVIYGVLAALVLAAVGMRGETVGVLLWPAVAAHVILAVLLLRSRPATGTDRGGVEGT